MPSRVIARRLAGGFLWEADDGRSGPSFSVEGLVTMHASQESSWLDVEGSLRFSDDWLDHRTTPVDVSGWGLSLRQPPDPDSQPWLVADDGRLVSWAALDRISRGKTLALPHRRWRLDGKAACCTYSREGLTVEPYVTFVGLVEGKSVAAPPSFAPTTSWIEV